MKTLYFLIITTVGIVTIAVGIYMLIFPSTILSTENSPSCSTAPNNSRDEILLKQVTWLSVMEIEKNQTKLDCTIVNQETFSHMPKLEQSLSGADKCYHGQDGICSFPSGIGMSMISDG